MAGATSLSDPGSWRMKWCSNHFLGQEGDTAQLAVFFPGLGYTCDMPAFYYPRICWRIPPISCALNMPDGPATSFKSIADIEQFEPLFDDATAAWNAVRTKRPYQSVTLIGKSLGTMAVGRILATDRSAPEMQVIWLTPLLRSERLLQQMQAFRGTLAHRDRDRGLTLRSGDSGLDFAKRQGLR